MSNKSPTKVFVSFFDVCLENFPESGFVHRLIPPDIARTMINKARRDKTLQFVAYDDYNAPYKKSEKNKCLELCSALKEHRDISVSFEDFQLSHKEDKITTIFPLNLVEIRKGTCLLVINCAYSLKKESSKKLDFEIDPDSIEFHLFALNELRLSQEDDEWLDAALVDLVKDWEWEDSKTDEVSNFLKERKDEPPQERESIRLMIKGRGTKKISKTSDKRKIKARSGRK